MDKEEIFRYVEIGKSRSVSVDRCLIEQYPGIIRNVIIKQNAKLQVDFLDKHVLEIDEGEISLYFYYEDYDKLFKAVEEYIGISMEDWVNYTKSEWYPETVEIDLNQSWEKLKSDFVDKKLHLPVGYKEYSIRDLYWEALDSGEVKVNDPESVFHEWLDRKMHEQDEMYDED